MIRQSDNPTCLYAMFKGNSKQVSKVCKTVILLNATNNVMLNVEPNKHFISSSDDK